MRADHSDEIVERVLDTRGSRGGEAHAFARGERGDDAAPERSILEQTVQICADYQTVGRGGAIGGFGGGGWRGGKRGGAERAGAGRYGATHVDRPAARLR